MHKNRANLIYREVNIKGKRYIKLYAKINDSNIEEYINILKGTVSREELLNCGLGEMDRTLTMDRT